MPRTRSYIFFGTCQFCGKLFTCRDRNAIFCSRKCWGESRHLPEIPCPICGTVFRPIEANHKFCSFACSRVHLSRLHSRPVYVHCENCGKEYRIKPCHVGKSRFCSRACKDADWYYNIRPKMLKEETLPERKVREALTSAGINFIPQHTADIYLIDFYLPDYQVAIEVDGVYWHNLPGAKERDSRKDDFLRSVGLRPIRITDKTIKQTKDLCNLLKELIAT